jgi:hypothetical protein
MHEHLIGQTIGDQIKQVLSPAIDANAPYAKVMIKHLEDIALTAVKHAVAAEREECAKIAEEVVTGTDNISVHEARGAEKVAAAIRAR